MQHMMPIRTDFSWRLDKKHSGLVLNENSTEGILFESQGKSGNFDFGSTEIFQGTSERDFWEEALKENLRLNGDEWTPSEV